MQTFRVWAPLPEKMEIQVNDRRFPMTPAAGGWWTAEVPADGVVRYGFFVDGEGPFPDPRSSWQPDGVHGLSRRVDQEQFCWTDSDWRAPPLSSAVIYELHIGTFTDAGTFAAAMERLDHLVELGVTHLELMPVNEFVGRRGWGYDGVGLFAPHHVYGGPDGLKQLVAACHARRLAVILDVVYNHLGPEGNYLMKFAPYFTTRYSAPWGQAINFDGAGSDEVRRFFCDNALMWLRDYHFDGLRLDAVQAIYDQSAQPFLEQLAGEVQRLGTELGRHLVLIPESDLNDPRLLWSPERGGFGLDAQWSDDFHHALHTVLTGEQNGYYADFGALADLDQALTKAFVYAGRYSERRQRRHGRSPAGLDGRRFVGYLQNHDQVGNRADGARSSRLMSPGLLKTAAAIVLTAPFVPLLFQGEEWGATAPFFYFTDYSNPKLQKTVREGRCREFAVFGWKPEDTADPQAADTFERSKLNWSELSEPAHAGLLAWHRRLIELRRTEPALADGRLEDIHTAYDEAGRWLVIDRGPLRILCNFAGRPQPFKLPAGQYRLLLASEPARQPEGDAPDLPAHSVAIFKREGNWPPA